MALFREDKEFKKKAKKISELTKDVSEFLDQNLKLSFKKDKALKYNIAYHSACSMQHGQKVHKSQLIYLKRHEIKF